MTQDEELNMLLKLHESLDKMEKSLLKMINDPEFQKRKEDYYRLAKENKLPKKNNENT